MAISLPFFLGKNFLKIYKLALTKRTILFVTNQKIRSFNLGPVTQLSIFFCIAWTINVFFQSLYYHRILAEKSQEISELKYANGLFEEKVLAVNERLEKVNNYLALISEKPTKVSFVEDFQANKDLTNFSKSDKRTAEQINEAELNLSQIQGMALERIKKMEKLINITGLNLKNTTTSHNNSPKGGPFIPNSDKSGFLNQIDRLIKLEKLVAAFPLLKPMRTYYISSGFGTRSDPINGGWAIHQGLDFVGPSKAKVISSSSGKILLARRFGDYGNAVVIDHGFGLTTRYAHLSKILVGEGQAVKTAEEVRGSIYITR